MRGWVGGESEPGEPRLTEIHDRTHRTEGSGKFWNRLTISNSAYGSGTQGIGEVLQEKEEAGMGVTRASFNWT